MKNSYHLFRIFKIPIRLHIVFLLVFPLLVLSLASTLTEANGFLESFFYASLVYGFLFASVLMHELTHSLVAIKNGVKVREIILTPIGGIANIGMVSDARKELVISIAGPLSNVVLAAVLFILSSTFFGLEQTLSNLGTGLMQVSLPSLVAFVIYINIILAMFNLFLPIFPMDGGRVLRSMLGLVTDNLTATRWAVRIGRGFLVFFILGALFVGSLWLVIIGVFLFFAGSMELKATEMNDAVRNIDLKQVAYRNLRVLHKDMTVEDALTHLIPWQRVYPVLDDEQKPVGYVAIENFTNENSRKRLSSLMDRKAKIVKNNSKDLLRKLYEHELLFLVREDGTYYGLLTLENLQRAIRLSNIKPKKSTKINIK